MNKVSNLKHLILASRRILLNQHEVFKSNQWQSRKEKFEFMEYLNLHISAPMPDEVIEMDRQCDPFRPWADEHFEERVGGVPLNPPPSHKHWLKDTDKFMVNEQFSHSYPDRLWASKFEHVKGIKFDYAGLSEAVKLLEQDPTTRQCYVPIWFPEDLTAATLGERVPCTMGWHFIVRNGKLHCNYTMRSCDAVRHFHNDIYLATRLSRWMLLQSGLWELGYDLGDLTFNCVSFHCFTNDEYTLKKLIQKGEQ